MTSYIICIICMNRKDTIIFFNLYHKLNCLPTKFDSSCCCVIECEHSTKSNDDSQHPSILGSI